LFELLLCSSMSSLIFMCRLSAIANTWTKRKKLIGQKQ
jgi:hypothetical protein